MCDGELQDRVISCISEVVERCNSSLHSGWRPIFSALRSIKVPFLAEVDLPPAQPTSNSSSDSSHNATEDGIATCSKVNFDDELTPTQKVPNMRRISTVLEIFEVSGGWLNLSRDLL